MTTIVTPRWRRSSTCSSPSRPRRLLGGTRGAPALQPPPSSSCTASRVARPAGELAARRRRVVIGVAAAVAVVAAIAGSLLPSTTTAGSGARPCRAPWTVHRNRCRGRRRPASPSPPTRPTRSRCRGLTPGCSRWSMTTASSGGRCSVSSRATRARLRGGLRRAGPPGGVGQLPRQPGPQRAGAPAGRGPVGGGAHRHVRGGRGAAEGDRGRGAAGDEYSIERLPARPRARAHRDPARRRSLPRESTIPVSVDADASTHLVIVDGIVFDGATTDGPEDADHLRWLQRDATGQPSPASAPSAALSDGLHLVTVVEIVEGTLAADARCSRSGASRGAGPRSPSWPRGGPPCDAPAAARSPPSRTRALAMSAWKLFRPADDERPREDRHAGRGSPRRARGRRRRPRRSAASRVRARPQPGEGEPDRAGPGRHHDREQRPVARQDQRRQQEQQRHARQHEPQGRGEREPHDAQPMMRSRPPP